MARIKVKHTVLGTHNWPGADKHFPEVGFLKHEHHHDFHFYVECGVEHHDREIEFIMLRMDLMKIIDDEYPGKYMRLYSNNSERNMVSTGTGRFLYLKIIFKEV